MHDGSNIKILDSLWMLLNSQDGSIVHKELIVFSIFELFPKVLLIILRVLLPIVENSFCLHKKLLLIVWIEFLDCFIELLNHWIHLLNKNFRKRYLILNERLGL